MKIRKLPVGLIQQLAAGEVVENPSSIIKELISNSIDAGASSISVSLLRSGISRLIVEDDGSGIHRDDLVTAFYAHTTSKVSDDITNISTLGYRGEALSSIVQVSRTKLMSKLHDDETGWSAHGSYGDINTDVFPCSMNVGTRVEVTDLFLNQPARLKFLKGERAELNRTQRLLSNFAALYPSISFSLRAGGNILFYQKYCLDSTNERGRLSYFFGASFAERAIQIPKIKNGDMEIDGWIALPVSDRSRKSVSLTSVNGHCIPNSLLAKGIKSAVRNEIGKDCDVDYILRLSLNPNEIDVNVHPRKEEVRFRDDRVVQTFLKEVVSDVLKQNGLTLAGEMSEKAKSFSQINMKSGEESIENPLGRAMGQAHKSWLVAETPTGIALIDQHAAHERIVLERLKSCLAGATAQSTPLPSPVLCDLPEDGHSALMGHKDSINTLGLHFSDFDRNSIIVTDIPSLMASCDVRKFVENIAADLSENEDDTLMNQLTEILAMAACRASIKLGDILDLDDVDTFLRLMERTPNASRCIHGRPSIAFFNNRDLGKLFDR